MAEKNIDKTNNPANAMSSVEDVHSNDNKLKQDFPGFPHNPASEDNLVDEQKNWKTDFSNESNTTATGSESVRGERPTTADNSTGNDDEDFLFSKNLIPGPDKINPEQITRRWKRLVKVSNKFKKNELNTITESRIFWSVFLTSSGSGERN